MHYALLVIGNGSLEERLQPFEEWGCRAPDPHGDDPLVPYLKFLDMREEIKEYIDEDDLKKYGSLEVYAAAVEQCEFIDGIPGRWHNPNGYWDWWQIGGRYSEIMRHKDGRYIAHGLKNEVDFSLDQKLVKYANRKWEIGVEGAEKTESEIKNRDYVLVECEKYLVDNFRDKETHAKTMASFYTYAVLDMDGNWHERTKQKIHEWAESFYSKFIEHLPDDTPLTIVDYHN